VAQCLACKGRRITRSGGALSITSPLTDPAERARVARESRIKTFLDVSLTAMQRSMSLAVAVTDAESGRAVWARTYSSEDERVSPDATAEGVKRVMQYRPSVQYRATLYSMFQPDVSGSVFCLGAGFRMVERYDNRTKEIGFELDFFKETATLTGASTQPTSLYGGINLTLLILHAWNFIGDVEDPNKPRFGVVAGIGGTFASNFLGMLGRAGVEARLGKHTALSLTLGYRPASQLLLAQSSTLTPVAGIETGAGLSYLF
jgi:hypothetical protein